MIIKYTIPYVKDDRLQYTDRIILGFLLLLSDKGKNKEIFFSKEILEEMQINLNTLKAVLKRLEALSLIQIRIEQNYIYKQRSIILSDEVLKTISEYENVKKTRIERKNNKNGTEIPPTNQKSILCNSDTDLRDIFISVAEKLYKENKIIVKGYMIANEIERFKKYYLGKQINDETVEKWLLKLKEFNKE